jgi:hypothetical protein
MTTLALMVVCLLVFASIMAWSFSNLQLTQQNNQYNMSENAAESAVERVIGQIDRDFLYASVSNSSAYTGLPAGISQSLWPVQYTFSDTNGATGVVTVAISPTSSSSVSLNSQYSGLSGLVQNCDVYATATPIGQRYNTAASVHESLQYATIPLFQFAIFYNVNLEIDPGANMIVTGPVFCNQSIWEGSTSLSFASTVTAVGTNCMATSTYLADPFALNYNGTGASTFASPPVSHANALVMPIGTNNNPNTIMGLLQLPPSAYAMGTTAAYSTNGMAYPANAADIVITNFASAVRNGTNLLVGTNLIVYYQNYSLTPMPYDFYIITNANLHNSYTTNYVASTVLGPNTNIYYAGFSWVSNVVFYDWREGWNGGSGPAKTVQAVQIDVAKFSVWLTNQSVVYSGYTSDQTTLTQVGHHLGGMYVYNSVPLTGSQLPAVRVMNGAQLPNPGNASVPYGFTVATPFPLYVWGNYNSQNNGVSALGLWSTNGTTVATANTLPAALMADSVTILSTNWNDSVTSKMPNPGNTTVNAAMLEGIVASNPSISGNYSGGVENFLRLLENWNNDPTGAGNKQVLTYNGSIVVLFYSEYATNSWVNTGNYYNPPTRNWAFDLNFKNANKLPPMTPASRAMIRGNWYAHQ